MELNLLNSASLLGAALAMGFGAIGSGWGIGYAGVGASRAMARQPNQNSALFRTMLIGQAVASNPSIFALVIAVLLYNLGISSETSELANNWAAAAAVLGAGLSVGLGAIGSGGGNGLIAADALEAIARTPRQTGKITVMMIVGQAVGQTPVLFSLVISLILIVNDGSFASYTTFNDQLLHAGRLLGMGLCIGLGAMGPGFGSSYIGGKLCEALAKTPAESQHLNNVYFVGVGVSQSCAIYAFVISLLLMSAN
jgi:F0F1-type ATP synthase membrane subunit c/vacuolar-type H+-ATPase subunit K